jgi:hypothetical protein
MAYDLRSDYPSGGKRFAKRLSISRHAICEAIADLLTSDLPSDCQSLARDLRGDCQSAGNRFAK